MPNFGIERTMGFLVWFHMDTKRISESFMDLFCSTCCILMDVAMNVWTGSLCMTYEL
jgi:hypothetical protein